MVTMKYGKIRCCPTVKTLYSFCFSSRNLFSFKTLHTNLNGLRRSHLMQQLRGNSFPKADNQHSIIYCEIMKQHHMFQLDNGQSCCLPILHHSENTNSLDIHVHVCIINCCRYIGVYWRFRRTEPR